MHLVQGFYYPSQIFPVPHPTPHPPGPTPLPSDARHVRSHDSGKTSLLLHYALSRAASTGGTVLFVCRRDKVEASPPVLPLGVRRR